MFITVLEVGVPVMGSLMTVYNIGSLRGRTLPAIPQNPLPLVYNCSISFNNFPPLCGLVFPSGNFCPK